MDKKRCPICNHILYKKHEGLVCKNHLCELGNFKYGTGWVYIKNKKDTNFNFINSRKFSLEIYENTRKWLLLKSQILEERGIKCELCKSTTNIHIHHILPRNEYPELTFDKENLMVVCSDCHKKLHKKDKYKFS